MSQGIWSFTSLVGEERLANLEGETSFEAIAGEIRQTMTVLCCHEDPCDRGPGDTAADGRRVALFRRPVYCISVARPLFDRFFNSRHGYRGAYFRLPYEGLQANDLLMRTVAPGLIAADPSGGAALGAVFIEASLKSGSAKAWLTEQNGFCPLCAGEFPPASDDGEIVNGRWELGTCVQSRDGRRAPYLTKIKVIGAFLNDSYDEFIPTRKRRRHWDIHEWGWS